MLAKYQVLFDRTNERIRFVNVDDGQIVNAKTVLQLAEVAGCAFVFEKPDEEFHPVNFLSVTRDRRFNQSQCYILLGLETE